ncbi:MAG: endopeptidase La [Pseudomonadota bacterium]|nr:MAG: endopeptidase La [Pseudomonadota bacterium]
MSSDIDSEHDAPSSEILPPEGESGSPARGITVASDILPTTLHILPVTDRPFLPAQAMPLLLDEAPWMETVEQIGDTAHHMAGLLLSGADEAAASTVDDFASYGTVVRMHNPMHAEGKIQFIAEGRQRFRIVKWLSKQAPYVAQVEYPEELQRAEDADQEKAYAMAIISTLKELVTLNPLYSEELKIFLDRFNINDPSSLSDFAAALTSAETASLQDILETLPVLERMKKVITLLKKELELAKLQAKIHRQVEQTMGEQQRKFFLREQLKAIQKELGIAKDDRTADVERFRERLDALQVPDAAMQRINDELDKLGILETGSPEYSVTRSYLDWITALPWGNYSADILDLEHARKVLDRDHEGLEDVKQRIVEFLAVGTLKGEIGGSILLLVGPPGVGKTSIGRSIADTLGRKFYRFSLGGMRDEAEIKGHRRTYIGAMPGKFIQAIKDADTSNPVIMLDEIDKVGASFRGDPASALLEVLDPEQNRDFLDHYLDVRYDLSRVLFICTANQLDTIPAPLLDRMEVIRLAGYITEEKLRIAKKHLLPRRLRDAGVKRGQLKLSDAALRHLIEGYAREAGVRALDKQLGRVVRKAVVKLVSGEKGPIRLGIEEIEENLGKPLFAKERMLSGVGVVTGLAWTTMGGATLSVEATLVHTKNRGFKLTGQLGDVMRESAEIAYSYVASHLADYRGDSQFFDEAFVHLHVPEGATPKDGPSAGVTMATALLSLARQQKPLQPLAMTGELTLTGQVLPVGGIREKVIAARRAGIRRLILPEANRRDFDELPDHVRKGMTAHFAEHFSDVAAVAFRRR